MSHDRDRRRMLLAGVGAVGAMAMARTARAASCGDPGPLDPTGPTMRTLSTKIARTDDGIAEARIPITSLPSSATAQFVISAPGVYYMTGNITGEAGKNCIEIFADNVEIECDGHVFLGVAGTRSCLCTPGAHRCIGVYDGGFVGWQGISCEFSLSSDCYVEECWFDSCDASSSPIGGFCCILGSGGTIDDCNVLSCVGGTLFVGANGIIEECSHLGSTGACFASPGPVTIEDNFAQNSSGDAVSVTGSAVVIGNRCVATGAIRVGGGSVVAENDLSSCSSGISVSGEGSTIEENHLSSCASGIVLAPSTKAVLVDGNHLSGTAVPAIQALGSGCLIVRNAVTSPPGVPGYDLVPGNSWGTIFSAVGVGDLASTGVTPDAWTNFLY